MNTPTKLGAYAVGLLAVFGAATGVGTALGPVGSTGSQETMTEHTDTEHTGIGTETGFGTAHTSGGQEQHGDGDHAASSSAGTQDVAGGLMVSDRGYTLSMRRDTLPAGPSTAVSFRVLGLDGAPVVEYDRTHGKDLHFIAVRRDMTGFQHVHPQLSPDGRWSVPLALEAGEWRVFADFVATEDGERLTLGADVSVAGDYRPRALPAPSRTAQVDGYTVTRDGRLTPGQESQLTLSVTRDGRPVTDLQPYLAAYGHLVVLRDADLAYLHVHPAGEPGDGETEPGPDIMFYATAPSVGDYRLFLDFRHDGVVRTAEFTAAATSKETP